MPSHAPTDPCHWLIETPNGATSLGRCLGCGATKEFGNSAEQANELAGRARLDKRQIHEAVARPRGRRPLSETDPRPELKVVK